MDAGYPWRHDEVGIRDVLSTSADHEPLREKPWTALRIP